MYLHHHRQNDTVPIVAVNLQIPPSFLPEHLIREILLRLPVKSLVQLKCVCKSWKTLISDPQFAKSHLQIPRISAQQLVFPVLDKQYKIVSHSLKPLLENPSTPVKPVIFGYMNKHVHKYLIIGSCNGLLCLLYRYRNIVRLCNPSIMFKSRKSSDAVSLDWMIIQYGFGYDHVNDKYKVLVVAHNKNDSTQSLTKLYTFGDGCWKTIPNFFIRPTRRLGKFASGTLNWMIYKTGYSFNHFMIFSFDLEKETYREMLLPQNNGDYKSIQGVLYVLSDCLCVCEISGVVWLMKEYGVVESWMKLMIIPHEKFIQSQRYFVEPLFISKDSVLLMRSVYSQIKNYNPNIDRYRIPFDEPLLIFEDGGVAQVKQSSSQLVLYNSNSGGLDHLMTSTLGLHQHIYRESLISLIHLKNEIPTTIILNK